MEYSGCDELVRFQRGFRVDALIARCVRESRLRAVVSSQIDGVEESRLACLLVSVSGAFVTCERIDHTVSASISFSPREEQGEDRARMFTPNYPEMQ